jgi:hypothetical protein
MTERVFVPKFKIPHGAHANHRGIDYPGMMTWKNQKNGFAVAVCHYTADPEKCSEAWYRETTKDLRSDQRDREYEINFESRAGKKAFAYLLESPRRYQVPGFKLKTVPKHWRIIASLDYGTQNPTAIYFWGVDTRRRFFSLFEYYKPSSVREIAAVLKGEHQGPNLDGEFTDYRHPLWRRCEKVVVDGAIFRKDQDAGDEGHKSIGDLLEEEGIHIMERATKDRIAGLERMHGMFNHHEDPEELAAREPYLFISKRCPHLWKELTELVYEELPPHLLINKNQKEDVVAKNDHAYDSARYALMSVEAPSSKPPEPRPGEGTLGAVEKEMDLDDHEKTEVDFF